MVGTVLLVVSEGFNDMAFLANQVIIEEAGNDVIPASGEGGAVKGETSSVMTVKFDEAITQDIEYDALVLVGGNHLENISGLSDTVKTFHSQNKIIAALGSGVDIIQKLAIAENISEGNSSELSGNCLTLSIPEDTESFAEQMVKLISS